MAFYKARLQKKSGLYYPQAVVVGKQVTTKQLGKALSDRSTVTLADTLAVLSELGAVMSTFMAQGRSVSLEGLGCFRYTINSQKQGVEKEEDTSVRDKQSISKQHGLFCFLNAYTLQSLWLVIKERISR